jgi:hypothetical protein
MPGVDLVRSYATIVESDAVLAVRSRFAFDQPGIEGGIEMEERASRSGYAGVNGLKL